jgi:hypothetical protein
MKDLRDPISARDNHENGQGALKEYRVVQHFSDVGNR